MLSGSAFDREDLDAILKLDDLVDRTALGELCQSFYALFAIPVRILSAEGGMLAGASSEHEVCAYANAFPQSRSSCGKTVNLARTTVPGPDNSAVCACFTGNVYRIVAIEYDGRVIGRLVIGPYLEGRIDEAPRSFTALDREIDGRRALTLLQKVPVARPETVARITAHLKAVLDLILFSGHKAYLTSHMHLASVRENYQELSKKNQKLQESYDRLKELDQLKSNFLGTVSHELRTPLTSIIGYGEMLSDGVAGQLLPEQMEFVKTIQEKGEQLVTLIKGLLDLTKLESGTATMRRQPLHVGELLREVLTTLQPVARKKGIALLLDTDGDSEMRGDPERLRQVFINLVENAVKFTPQGGTVTVQLHAEGDDDDDASGASLLASVQTHVEVRVIDTGIGLPKHERHKVFDPFYQVDSSSTRQYGGTGLGLSIVKRLVEAHGGTVTIEENVPQGTIFIVSLPTTGVGTAPSSKTRIAT